MSRTDFNLDEQSYEIIDELKIRKEIETQTDWSYEFTKGGTYDYDLEIHRWPKEPDSQEDRHLFGYLELERADHKQNESWISGDLPDSWSFLSFLQRKIYQWESDCATYENGDSVGGFSRETLKPEYRRAVYLKYNHTMDNCFAAPIPTIVKDGSGTPWSDGTYNWSFLSLPKDHKQVAVGPEECVELITEFLNGYAVQQSGLEEFL